MGASCSKWVHRPRQLCGRQATAIVFAWRSAQRTLKIHTLLQCKEIGNGYTLESVGRFGYLGDMQIVEQTVWLLWGMMCLEEVQRVVSHLDFQRGIT